MQLQGPPGRLKRESRFYFMDASRFDCRAVTLRAWAGLTLCLALSAAHAQQAANSPGQPTVSANELVKEAVAKELHQAQRPTRFMYRMRKQTPEKVETKQYVETDDGT